MSNKRRLWQIFGPVICALILLTVVLLLPWQRTYSNSSVFEAANSQTRTVFQGSKMKKTAFEKNYVPFYGSSELSRFDPLHPSVLAYKYRRTYRPFLLGGPGSQSLAHYFGMQEANAAANKKAVMIISPQWFTKFGQNPDAFSLYYSPLQAIDFLLNAKDSIATRYAARRLLKMPSSAASETVHYALLNIAAGQKLSKNQILLLKAKKRMLETQDTFFSSFQLRDRTNKIHKEASKLPANYSVSALHKVAKVQGEKNTKTNDFGINDKFFKKRLPKFLLRKLKGSQKQFDYTKSVEYSDFELILNQFAKQHVDVLFVIAPINEKWAKYTGLSQQMYQQSVAKIKTQLLKQGFNNIADFSKDGNKPYFMQDTIHLGWDGWVYVDQAVNRFMRKAPAFAYHLNNYYYTKKWQNQVKVKAPAVSLSAKSIKQQLKLAHFKGNIALKQGTKTVNFNTYSANKLFMINSLQKMMTGFLVLKEVEGNRLHLTDKLSKFYPQVPNAGKMTILDLLQMKTGYDLRPSAVYGTTPFKSNQAGLQSDIKKMTYTKLPAKRQWLYSNLNYLLLGGIIEQTSHQTYEQLFKREIIDKLNLKQTVFAWRKPGELDGHVLTKRGKKVIKVNTSIDSLRGIFAAGSVLMSTHDLLEFVQAYIGGKLLNQQTDHLRELVNPATHYNAGVYHAKDLYFANGDGAGYLDYVRVSKNKRTIIVSLSNYSLRDFVPKNDLITNISRQIFYQNYLQLLCK